MKQEIDKDYMPTVVEVNKYLDRWNHMENYVNQENALNKLFFDLCKRNDNIEDVLIKCSTLNDFYSTNIFDIHSVAKHILELNIDSRLEDGDVTLVNDIANVYVGVKHEHRYFYSFATKYCSHHQPLKYSIYDQYVDDVLNFFRRRDDFTKLTFNSERLKKNYGLYLEVIRSFQEHYRLSEFNLKQMDQYLWQLGRDYYNPYTK